MKLGENAPMIVLLHAKLARMRFPMSATVFLLSPTSCPTKR